MRKRVGGSFVLFTLWVFSQGMLLGNDCVSNYRGMLSEKQSYFDETVRKQLLLYGNLAELEWRLEMLLQGDNLVQSGQLDIVELIESSRQLQEELGCKDLVNWKQVRNWFEPKRSNITDCRLADMLREINQDSKDILSLITEIRNSISTFNDCVNRCTKLVGATNQSDGHLYVKPNGLTITQPGLYCMREYIDASSGMTSGSPTIIIASEDVTLDFRDNTLRPNTTYSVTTREHGVWVQRSNVTVRNGAIYGSPGGYIPFCACIVVVHSDGSSRLSNVQISGMTLAAGTNYGSGIAMYHVDDSRIFRVRTGYCNPAGFYLRGCNNILVEHSTAQYMTGTGFLVNDTGDETSSGVIFRDNMAIRCGISSARGGFLMDNASTEDNLNVLLMSNVALSCIGFGFKNSQSNTTGNIQLLNNFARSFNPAKHASYANYLNYCTTGPDYTPQDFTTGSHPFGVNIST